MIFRKLSLYKCDKCGHVVRNAPSIRVTCKACKVEMREVAKGVLVK